MTLMSIMYQLTINIWFSTNEHLGIIQEKFGDQREYRAEGTCLAQNHKWSLEHHQE